MDVLEEKRAEAAPNALYARSWARAIGLVKPAWRAEETSPYRVSDQMTDAGAALALALYLIAAAEDTDPEHVTRAQVEALRLTVPGSGLHLPTTPTLREINLSDRIRHSDMVAEWETRLRVLGHDIDDGAGSDPVVAHWRVLRRELGPPQDAPDGVWDDSTLRVGPAFIDGMNAVLAPVYAGDLDF